MKLMKRVALVASMLTLGSVATVAVASPATQDPIAVGKNGMKMGTSYQNDVSLPLYYLPSREVDADADHKEGPANPFIDSNHQDSPDPVIQHTKGPNPLVPAPILNFDGIPFPGVGCNCAPPDTNGEVGATQYVQIVNEGFQVFNKTTGASVLGPVEHQHALERLRRRLRDQRRRRPGRALRPARQPLADQPVRRRRRIPTDECIAVSTTSDATGTYNRYDFHLGSNFFDYPQLGVWPDAYYMSDNVFNSAGTALPRPAAVRVRPRGDARRRAGDVRQRRASLGGPSEAHYLPADLDGSTLPPAGRAESVRRVPERPARTRRLHVPRRLRHAGQLDVHAVRRTRAGAGFTQLCPGDARLRARSSGTGGDRSTASATG